MKLFVALAALLLAFLAVEAVGALATSRPSSYRPTKKPTASKKPTAVPTHKVTKPPTLRPSKRPTPQTTVKPTPKVTTRPSKRPTLPITAKPTPKPSAHPTKALVTAKPTVKVTDRPTAKPTVKATDRPTTSRPTPKPTTSRPTPKTTPGPTPKPTAMPSKATGKPTAKANIEFPNTGCTSRLTSSLCKADSTCEWASTNPCNYLVFPPQCSRYEYGCQAKATFCEFTQGTALDRQMQCNAKGFPCRWAKTACLLASRAPTPPPVPHFECSNTCIPFNRNGVCDDSSFCFPGTDCADCGPRWVP